jgi:hypothetical protein
LERIDKWEQQSDQFLLRLDGKTTGDLEKALPSSESEIWRELAEAIREIRYGSIMLVVHDGRLVEVTKTVRIRASRGGQRE